MDFPFSFFEKTPGEIFGKKRSYYIAYNEIYIFERRKMQSVYSVYGTKLHLILDDDFAEAYNRASEKFTTATVDPNNVDVVKSTVTLTLDMTDEERHAFNTFADLLNRLIEINGGGIWFMTEEDCTSNYLIKL